MEKPNARKQLEIFFNEVNTPNGIMPVNSLNQIAFAIQHASDEAIEQFIEWLYEGEENPNNRSLELLNQGNHSYEENFERVSEDYWKSLTVEVSDTTDRDEIESAICTEIDFEEPYGLDANRTCVYYSQGNWYVTTDFAEDGEPGKNPIIAMVLVEEKGKKKMSSFRINSKVIEKLKFICDHDHRSQSSEIEYLVNERYSQIRADKR